MTANHRDSQFLIPFPGQSTWFSGSSKPQRKFVVGCTLNRALTVSVVIVLMVVRGLADTAEDSPCLGCILFNQHITRPADKEKERELCIYPCQCPEELFCQDGVSVVKDGCSCCHMCARQLGDMCSAKDHCDTAKGLFCDRTEQNSIGVCKGRDKSSCVVHGVVYKDGEQFQPECSELCTCQNGYYGCVNTCPHEQQKPSELTCHEPKLIQVRNKCCREWTCQKMEVSGTSVLESNGLKSENLIFHQNSTLSHTEETTSFATTAFKQCDKQTTDWTPCSVTCDVGVSTRIVVDSISCIHRHELHICYIRPCGKDLDTLMGNRRCTPTVRRRKRHHIQYSDCRSVRDYSLKFCTNCRKNKCCYPHRTRMRSMEFECSNGKREFFDYMWIKKCRCNQTCDRKSSSSRRSGKGRGRGARARRKHRRKRRRFNQ